MFNVFSHWKVADRPATAEQAPVCANHGMSHYGCIASDCELLRQIDYNVGSFASSRTAG